MMSKCVGLAPKLACARRAFALSSCALLAVCLLPACGPRETPRPNVLLITVDTLRADHLGTYGFAFGSSPQIDALAATGVVWERAIAASGKTAPSHAAIMTARYTREHSIGHGNGTSTLVDATTLAEIFHESGYATGAFVGNILLTRRVGLAHGFEVYDDDLTVPEPNRPEVVERLAPDTTRRAIAWLGKQAARPFFLWVHYQDPHGPYTPPAEVRDLFDLPGPPDEPELPVGSGNTTGGSIPRYQVLPGLRRLSEYRSRYAGEIFFADREIGRLIAAADAHAARDTIVLLTADHGESFGEYGHYFKHTHTTTPDVARVPLILRTPGLAPGRRNDLVSHVDILPTLIALTGLPLPGGTSGHALVNRGGRAQTPPARFVYCDNGGQLSAYRGDSFLWMVGVANAWRQRADGSPTPFTPNWANFHWRPGRLWKRAEGTPPLPPEVSAYAQHATAMTTLPPPGENEVEQLRALGYVD